MHRRSRRIPTAAPQMARLVPALALGVGLMLLGAGTPAPAGAAAAGPQPAADAAPQPAADAAPQSPADAAPAGPLKTRLLQRTQLRTRPGGPVVATLERFTEYGSDRVLAVVARRGAWLGVLSEHMPTARAGWVPAYAAAEPQHARYALAADRSQRLLIVRRDGRVVRRIAIAVGRPGLETPTGRFAVTDALAMRAGTAYGCCVLAITALQAGLPAGRDRLAIHGTAQEGTIGSAASSGCLRARSADMRWLLSRITPGTVLRIRA